LTQNCSKQSKSKVRLGRQCQTVK